MTSHACDVLLGVLDPRNHIFEAASDNSLPTISQTADTYASFTVGASVALPLDSGALVYYPQRGYNSVQAFVAATIATPITTGLAVSIGAPLPLSANALNVSIAPPLDERYSMARTVASRLDFYAATVSATNATLGGTISAAAANDWREIDLFNPTSIVRSSATDRDSVLGVPAYQGVAMLLGSDINSDFVPLNYQRSAVYDDAAVVTLKGTTLTTDDLYFNVLNVSTVTGPFGGTIPPLTSPFADIVVRVHYSSTALTPKTVMLTFSYVQRDVAGPVVFSTSVTSAVGQATLPGTPDYFELKTERELWSIPKEAIFCGLSIGTYNATTGARVVCAITTQIEIQGAYEESNLGPLRCLTWTGFPAGVQVVLKGFARYEALAGTGLSQFLKTSAKSDDITTLPALSRLFNSRSSGLSRVFTIPALNMIIESHSRFIPEAINRVSAEDENAEKTFSAAGFFQNLGNAIGGAIGSRFGAGDLGGALGQIAGTMADKTFGASGYAEPKRRRLESGGMFGAAGMFGAPGEL